MGLDQYLYAKRCVTALTQNDYYAILNAVKADKLDKQTPTPHAMVEINVAYWRKANAIHGWFVRNCQEGVDDCREVLVDREDLLELRDLCEHILKNRELAEDLLPPTPGFFFGSDECDEYYFEDLEYTKTTLSKILDDTPLDWDFFYQSSW